MQIRQLIEKLKEYDDPTKEVYIRRRDITKGEPTRLCLDDFKEDDDSITIQ